MMDNAIASVWEKIIDLGRWAPSGDNGQPWRFSDLVEDRVRLSVFLQKNSVFNPDSFATHTSTGCLLATLRIAASMHGYRIEMASPPFTTRARKIYDLRLVADAAVKPDPLSDIVKIRSVVRSPYSTRRIDPVLKEKIEMTAGAGYKIIWLEGARKSDVIMLAAQLEKIKSFCPEIYREYKKVIEWGVKTSEMKMPSWALGLDPVSEKIGKYIMVSWARYRFFMTYMMGYMTSVIQMAVVPFWLSGAHFILISDDEPKTDDQYVAAGEVMQRIWLTLESDGIVHQPFFLPLCFSKYARKGEVFSSHPKAMQWAERGRRKMAELAGGEDVAARAVWMGRIGYSKHGKSRSLRLPLHRLLK